MVKYFVILMLVFFIAFSVYPQENITITTYYPAPMGVYENVRFFPTTVQPGCDANNEGVTYYNNNTNLLMVCRQTSTAPDTYAFQSAGSLWVQSGTTGPNGADPIAIRPFDTNLKVGIGDIDAAWNRQNRLVVTDNTTINHIGEQIALMEIVNPRRGNSGNWSGGGDSVTALQLTPGGASWQVRADEFSSAAAPDSAAAGAFMIHQTVNGNPATRLVIRNNGDVGIGTNLPRAQLDVNGGVKIGVVGDCLNDTAVCSATNSGTLRYCNQKLQYCDGSKWQQTGSSCMMNLGGKAYPKAIKCSAPSGSIIVFYPAAIRAGGIIQYAYSSRASSHDDNVLLFYNKDNGNYVTCENCLSAEAGNFSACKVNLFSIPNGCD